jgi:hypothetical protein
VALEQRIAAILNQRLASPLRVELDEVSHTSETGQANLTALARDVQATLDELEQGANARLTESHVWEDGGLRVRWHARRREPGEQADPVVVT